MGGGLEGRKEGWEVALEEEDDGERLRAQIHGEVQMRAKENFKSNGLEYNLFQPIPALKTKSEISTQSSVLPTFNAYLPISKPHSNTPTVFSPPILPPASPSLPTSSLTPSPPSFSLLPTFPQSSLSNP